MINSQQIHKLLEHDIKKWHDKVHYGYQKKIVYAILDGVIKSRQGETVEIPIELPRQSGKTTCIVDVTEFLLTSFKRFFDTPVSIGIFAPQREQAVTDFDRLKEQYVDIQNLGFTTRLETIKGKVNFPQKWNSKTVRLYDVKGNYYGEVYVFPLNKTSHPESKTLHIMIFEEAQDIDDKIMMKAAFPMGAATNAIRIYIGTAGTRLCYFKSQLDTNPRAIKIGLPEIVHDRRRAFELDGDASHLYYEKFIANEIKEHGSDSEYLRTQYFGEWIIGSGQFVTAEDIDSLIEKDRGIIEKVQSEIDDKGKIIKEASPVYIGIDTAKHIDRTVATAIKDCPDEMKSELCGWLSLQGDNYEDQFEIIKDWMMNFEDIRAVAIDATGQGDFMPDKFERHTSYNIIRCTFSMQFKDMLYKNLLQVIRNKLTSLPDVPFNEDFRRFFQQMVNLEKEYKGRFLSVHHPDDAKAHDDYPDSWALAEWAKTEIIKKQPGITFI